MLCRASALCVQIRERAKPRLHDKKADLSCLFFCISNTQSIGRGNIRSIRTVRTVAGRRSINIFISKEFLREWVFQNVVEQHAPPPHMPLVIALN